MPVLTLSHIHKAFGPQVILDDVSLTVMRSARIGLIGRNGEGKSTLLKLISGLIEADTGSLTLRNGTRVAYLPQAPHYEPGQSVFDVVASGLEAVGAMLGEYDRALQALELVGAAAAQVATRSHRYQRRPADGHPGADAAGTRARYRPVPETRCPVRAHGANSPDSPAARIHRPRRRFPNRGRPKLCGRPDSA